MHARPLNVNGFCIEAKSGSQLIRYVESMFLNGQTRNTSLPNQLPMYYHHYMRIFRNSDCGGLREYEFILVVD
jgi:hypothetical protein